jgi:hypothetical protein
MDQEDAWRLWTKGLSLKKARQRVTIIGVVSLGDPVLGMVSLIA